MVRSPPQPHRALVFCSGPLKVFACYWGAIDDGGYFYVAHQIHTAVQKAQTNLLSPHRILRVFPTTRSSRAQPGHSADTEISSGCGKLAPENALAFHLLSEFRFKTFNFHFASHASWIDVSWPVGGSAGAE